MVDSSALGSVVLSLDELVDRLRSITATTTEDDEVGSELREVERQLETAARRLDKAARQAGR